MYQIGRTPHSGYDVRGFFLSQLLCLWIRDANLVIVEMFGLKILNNVLLWIVPNNELIKRFNFKINLYKC